MSDFLPFRIKALRSNEAVSFDVYIYFHEQFLCYLRSGKSLSNEKLEKLKKQKITKFFIHLEQEDEYRKLIDKMIQEVSSEDMPLENRVDLACDIGKSSIENLGRGNAGEEDYKDASNVANMFYELVTNDAGALRKILEQVNVESDWIVQHSVNVCSLVVKYGTYLGLADDILADLAVAGLIHDIGLISLSERVRHLFNTPKLLLTMEDKIRYWKHASEGILLFKSKTYINDRVKEFVICHEEYLDGSGPQGLTEFELPQRLLNMVNVFDKERTVLAMSPAQAFEKIEQGKGTLFDKTLVDSFYKFLKSESLL